MRNLRLLLISLLLVLSIAMPVALLGSVSAANSLFPKDQLCDGVSADEAPAICSSNTDGTNPITGPGGVILKVANLIAFIGGVFAVFVIVVSGIRYMLSSGDSARINTAKNAILFSAIGLVIIALANTIVRFIVSKL